MESLRAQRRAVLAAAIAIGVILVSVLGVGISQLRLTPSASLGPSGSGAASPTEEPNRPVTASTEELGIRLTLTLDLQRTVHGQRVWAYVTVRNIGPDLGWIGCGWPVGISVRPELPAEVERVRETWPVDGLLLRYRGDYEGTVWADGRRPFTPGPLVDTGRQIEGCPPAVPLEDLPEGPELPEGAAVGMRAAWDTDDYLGTRPMPGRYNVEVTFAFGRGDPGQLVVKVGLPLVVEGRGPDQVGPGQALDALLMDDGFRQTLSDISPAPRGGAIELEDDHWVVCIGFAVPNGPEGGRLVGVVDNRTGAVLDVRLEIPPERC